MIFLKFSIIIPVKRFNPMLEQCLNDCLKQKNAEVIVIPDVAFKFEGVRVLTLKGSPSDKRDFAAKKAKGEFLAFIDDDAFPDNDWLKNSLKYFKEGVVAVAGPAVTPEGEELKRNASGLIFSSFIGGGGLGYRYVKGFSKEVDDYPSVNFIVKKSDFEEVGGFDTKYWPGEDTILCLKLKKLGRKIIYTGDVVVFHHRRRLFGEHLKQVFSYALHRGFFAKKYPENSLKAKYFIPSVFVLSVVAGLILSLFYSWAFLALALVLFVYFLVVLLESLKTAFKEGSVELFFLFFAGVILTHFFYGVGFIKGLLSKDLTR